MRGPADQLTHALTFDPASPGLCLLSATGKLDLDLSAMSALGHLDLQADTSWNSQSLGQLQASINLNRRTADISNLQIKTLDGSATGSGYFDLDKPFTSRLALDWKNLNLAALKPLSADLASISGKSDGSLHVQPASTPRPLGPLAIDLRVHSNGIQFQNFKIGDLQTSAFLGPDRFALDDSPDRPSQIAIADGTIRFWGRVTRHDRRRLPIPAPMTSPEPPARHHSARRFQGRPHPRPPRR